MRAALCLLLALFGATALLAVTAADGMGGMYYRDQFKDEQRCPVGQVWSRNYEGGTCICPLPFNATAPGEEVIDQDNDGVEDLAVNGIDDDLDGLIDGEDPSEVLGTFNLPQPLHAKYGFYWDVVACAYVPRCPRRFRWNSIEQRCVYRRKVDCAKRCRRHCDRKQYPALTGDAHLPEGQYRGTSDCHAHCDRLVFDPLHVQCRKRCTTDVKCIQGTHFDSEKCRCVQNQCTRNRACPIGSSWSSTRCRCVRKRCPRTDDGEDDGHFNGDGGKPLSRREEVRAERRSRRRCRRGYLWDATVCECVPRDPRSCRLSCAYGEHPNFLTCQCEPRNTCFQERKCEWYEVFDHLRCTCLTPARCPEESTLNSTLNLALQIRDPITCSYLGNPCSTVGVGAPAGGPVEAVELSSIYNYTTGTCSLVAPAGPPLALRLSQCLPGLVDGTAGSNSAEICGCADRCPGQAPCRSGQVRNETCACVETVCDPRVCSWGQLNPTNCTCSPFPLQACPRGGRFNRRSGLCECSLADEIAAGGVALGAFSFGTIGCPAGQHRNPRTRCCEADNCPPLQVYNATISTCACSLSSDSPVAACEFGFDPFTCSCLPRVCPAVNCGVTAFQDPDTCECACPAGRTFTNETTALGSGPRCVSTLGECLFDVQGTPCQTGYSFNEAYCGCVPSNCTLTTRSCINGVLDSTLCKCQCPEGQYFSTVTNCCRCAPSVCPAGTIRDPFDQTSCSCIPEVCTVGDRTCLGNDQFNDYTCRCQAPSPSLCDVTEPCPAGTARDLRSCLCSAPPSSALGRCPIRQQLNADGICTCIEGAVRDSVNGGCGCGVVDCPAGQIQSDQTCLCEAASN